MTHSAHYRWAFAMLCAAAASWPSIQPRAGALAASAATQPAEISAQPRPELTPEIRASIDRGLAYLARMQQADGSFLPPSAPGYRAAESGLALLAFLGDGAAPDVGRYGSVVRASIDYLVDHAPADGYFGALDHRDKGMYTQGIVTLALAEACGVESRPARRAAERALLARAAGVILAAQNIPKPPMFAGGWRYQPNAIDSDISLAGWNALALRATRDAGVRVPAAALQKAAAFVLNCQAKGQPGFSYQPGQAPQISATAVGLLDLYVLLPADTNGGNIDHRPEIVQAAALLAQHPIDAQSKYPYYTFYYALQAAYQTGEPTWTAVSRPILAKLQTLQDKDGHWALLPGSGEPDDIYASALAILSLDVNNRLLPIFQR